MSLNCYRCMLCSVWLRMGRILRFVIVRINSVLKFQWWRSKRTKKKSPYLSVHLTQQKIMVSKDLPPSYHWGGLPPEIEWISLFFLLFLFMFFLNVVWKLCSRDRNSHPQLFATQKMYEPPKEEKKKRKRITQCVERNGRKEVPRKQTIMYKRKRNNFKKREKEREKNEMNCLFFPPFIRNPKNHPHRDRSRQPPTQRGAMDF